MRSIRRTLALWTRALRLPFLAASILPYGYGMLMPWAGWSTRGRAAQFSEYATTLDGFIVGVLGLIAVAATHLSANLFNDVADSRSGADWRDPAFYGFFGGSKLIQEGTLSERAYARAAWAVAAVGGLAVAALAVRLESPAVPLTYVAVLALAWSYSGGPLRLSHRGLGEAVVFLLFGPICVATGFLLQEALVNDIGEILDAAADRALPAFGVLSRGFGFGLLTAGVLVANEVPDAPDDEAVGKRTLVVRIGPRWGAVLYAFCIVAAVTALTPFSGFYLRAGVSRHLAVYACLIPAAGAVWTLARRRRSKADLLRASRLAILAQVVFGLALILNVVRDVVADWAVRQ
jgi:1,4-dihydroxy-2-naphthoate octaprenyltransferase